MATYLIATYHLVQRQSLVLFTHSAACSKVPNIPIQIRTSLEDPKYINLGMAPAAVAFRDMCASTLDTAGSISVPTAIPDDHINEETANDYLRMSTGTRPFHFLHKVVLRGLLFAAMIRTRTSSSNAVSLGGPCEIAGHCVHPLPYSPDQQAHIENLTSNEVTQMDAYIGSAYIPNLLCSQWMPHLMHMTNHLLLLQCTLEALRGCRYGWPDTVEVLKPHLDGSYCPTSHKAGWACIVLATSQAGETWFPGYMAGTVSAWEGVGDYSGADHTSADVAELHALAWSVMFSLQFTVANIEFNFDSLYAHGMATAFYEAKANCIATTILAGLHSMLEQKANVKWTHEKSHIALPYNEFADVAAKHEMRNGHPAYQISSPASSWALNEATYASWAFLFVASQNVAGMYPIKRRGDEMYLSASVAPVPRMALMSKRFSSTLMITKKTTS